MSATTWLALLVLTAGVVTIVYAATGDRILRVCALIGGCVSVVVAILLLTHASL